MIILEPRGFVVKPEYDPHVEQTNLIRKQLTHVVAVRQFWTRNQKPVLTRTLIRDVIVQLQGIAGALSVIHSKGFRHSDMKPENIVRQEMIPRNSGLARLDVGELKICDMGLTKYHDMATELRGKTDT